MLAVGALAAGSVFINAADSIPRDFGLAATKADSKAQADRWGLFVGEWTENDYGYPVTDEYSASTSSYWGDGTFLLAGSPAYTPPRVSPFADVATAQGFYKEMAWMRSW
ncbi:hypothetical protein [Kocuria kalidii]|uniref:hypothetical protein n=1 Tax=Kocuria kalidii TaxID=3376283 RepID=UPI00379465A1